MPSTSESPDTSTKKPTTSPSGADTPIADVKPCDLMPVSGISTLGLRAESEEKIGRGRACFWQVDRETAAESMTLAVVIYDTLGTSDIVATSTEPAASIGTHKTVKFIATDASACGLSFEITGKSRVDVQVVGTNVDKACEFAPGAAKLVEPELP